MEAPSDLLQRPPEEAATLVARGWLENARAAADRLDHSGDEDALHDFRVAVRRLRSTLRAWQEELAGSGWRKRRRELRALQRATGEGRDAEVALAWLGSVRDELGAQERPGFEHLTSLLEQRHRAAMSHAREGVRARFEALEARLARRLARVRIELDLDEPERTPCFGAALARRVLPAAAVLDAKLSSVRGLADRDGCHAARIACKRLRYLIEPAREHGEALVEMCKELQDRLGDLNDAHVLGEEIRRSEGEAPEDARPGLGALGRRLDEHARKLFEELAESWRGAGRVRLRTEAAAFARRCEEAARPALEIERKYLLAGLPDLGALRSRGRGVETLQIEQGWLPGRRLRERVRRTSLPDGTSVYTRTLKLGAGVQRIEIEEETSATLFEALWPLTEGCRIRKQRHCVHDGGRFWEIDEFLDRDLVLAEVELTDPETRPEPPAWLDVVGEVTDDPSYTNLSLAR